MRRIILVISAALAWSCTDSDLYSQTGQDPLRPDRIALEGEICTEDTSGSNFPVKVLVLMDTSNRMFEIDPDGIRFTSPLGGLERLVDRYRDQPHIRFGFVGVGSTSQALPPPDGQRFFSAKDIEATSAINLLKIPSGNEFDVTNAISQAESFITTDMDNSTPGEVLRSRYLVYLMAGGMPNPNTPQENLVQQLEKLRQTVYARGALEFRFNTGFFYYGPRTIDQGANNFLCYQRDEDEDLCPCSTSVRGTPKYCNVYCGVDSGQLSEETNENAKTLYRGLSLVGDGRLSHFDCPSLAQLDLSIATGAVPLVKKDIIAYNRNVILSKDGPMADSDGDGLTDAEELAAPNPTDPTLADTDGDGINDKLELRAAPQQDPLDPNDRPASCVDPNDVPALPDRDFDLLTDCEESLLQTDPSIPDTDGDGLPDSLEFFAGTVPTSREDRLLDFDGDGVNNAQEVAEHTNPRAFEGALRSVEAYRTNIAFAGLKQVPEMEDTAELRGITFRQGSPTIVGGQGYLRYNACERTLYWSDARFVASPQLQPIATPIDAGSGVYRLRAQSTLYNQATGEDEIYEEAWVDVFVAEPLLPTCEATEEVVVTPFISVSDRNCYNVRISNIKLKRTLAANGESVPGLNRIYVFFTQAPESRLDAPGISKIAEIIVRFDCNDIENEKNCARNPDDPIFELTDGQFTSALQ